MPEIEQFVSQYTAEVAHLSTVLRNTIQAHCPGCKEALHVRWKVISYGFRTKFCAIAPHGKWVNLQFHQGALLDDPHSLLEGSGKSMRHVKISTEEDVSPELIELVKHAAGRGR